MPPRACGAPNLRSQESDAHDSKTGTYAGSDPLNKGIFVTAKGLAGYTTTASGRHLILAVYVNRVLVSTAEDEITRVVGQALGEIANAVYLTN